ncbi:MAG: EAL domain-containing protein [Pseudomonadota bacterium]
MEETARIARVRELALDRIKSRDIFTQITELASEWLDCPVSAVSIIEADYVWYLSAKGLADPRVARDETFCAMCLETGEPLLVEDASEDPRYRNLSWAQKADGLQSYLGVPLKAEDGTLIGTVCCASPRAHAFAPSDIARLRTLADLAEQGINAHAKTLELSRANASLAKLNQVFKHAETARQIGSWRIDLQTDELFWSDQVYAIHGVPIGTPVDVEKGVQFYEPEDRAMVEESLNRALDEGEAFSFEASIRRQDGELRRIRTMGERIDVDGVPESLTGVFIDCTEEHERTIALERAATRDPLTGLYNRGEFDRRLVEALEEQRKLGPTTPLTAMLLDLDGFKDVNDRLGHLAGDRLLAQIAHTLDQTIGEKSFLARWGGDEFAILFPVGCTMDEAYRLTKTMISDLSGLLPMSDGLVQIGATCGLAEMRHDAEAQELIRRADLALYHGKANARGAAHCWSESIETAQAARQMAMAKLTDALNSGRAFAAYQPIVTLDGEVTEGVEALLRLRDTSGRVISAGEFFQALYDPTLARRVLDFMREQVVRDAPELLALFGPKTRIGLNVSEADLSHPDFLEDMDDLIERSVLEPANIVLEVTETMLLLDESGTIRERMETLDQRGFTIALDDFGTGFSSLTHLRDFPIRKVKIDKDFIGTMAHDRQSRLIVQAMVQMARSLEVRMVAEGVETDEQYLFLRSIGCSHAQGFRFARPGSVQELRALKQAQEQAMDDTVPKEQSAA